MEPMEKLAPRDSRVSMVKSVLLGLLAQQVIPAVVDWV
jgi:hypothetical protein